MHMRLESWTLMHKSKTVHCCAQHITIFRWALHVPSLHASTKEGRHTQDSPAPAHDPRHPQVMEQNIHPPGQAWL